MNYTGIVLIILIPIVIGLFVNLINPDKLSFKYKALIVSLLLISAISVAYNFWQKSQREIEMEKLEILRIQNAQLEEEKRHMAELENIEQKKLLKIKQDSLELVRLHKIKIEEEREIEKRNEEEIQKLKQLQKQKEQALKYTFVNKSSNYIEARLRKIISSNFKTGALTFKENYNKEDVRSLKNEYDISNDFDVISYILSTDKKKPAVVFTNDGVRLYGKSGRYKMVKKIFWEDLGKYEYTKNDEKTTFITPRKLGTFEKGIVISTNLQYITQIEVIDLFQKVISENFDKQ